MPHDPRWLYEKMLGDMGRLKFNISSSCLLNQSTHSGGLCFLPGRYLIFLPVSLTNSPFPSRFRGLISNKNPGSCVSREHLWNRTSVLTSLCPFIQSCRYF